MSATDSTRWFFPDWMSDPGIRASCLAARGLWKDLLCLAGMNKGADHGFVLLNGRIPSLADLARMVGASESEVAPLLQELETNGVFSRDRRKVIYCRRMVRAEKNRRNGKLGGNPNLRKNNDNQESLQLTPKAHIPVPCTEEPNGSSASAAAPPPPDDPKARLFREGLATLGRLTGRPAGSLRTILGKWLRETLDDPVAVLRAIEDAAANRVADPVSWIEAALRHRDGQPTRGQRARNGWAAMVYENETRRGYQEEIR
jgi:hypothetical protein